LGTEKIGLAIEINTYAREFIRISAMLPISLTRFIVTLSFFKEINGKRLISQCTQFASQLHTTTAITTSAEHHVRQCTLLFFWWWA